MSSRPAGTSSSRHRTRGAPSRAKCNRGGTTSIRCSTSFYFNGSNLTRLLREAGFEVLGVRTFGHHYRVGYVLDRLAYLYEGRATKVMRTLGRPLGKRTL